MAFLLSGCDPLIEKAKERVSRDMRDPGSVQFRELRRCAKPNAVEGEVNAKNAFGAYVGFKSFIYADGRAAILDDDDVDEWEELRHQCWSDETINAVEAEAVGSPNTISDH